MTRQLFLLRHAKSSWDDPSLADYDRPLAKRGRKAAAALRRYMKAEKIAPGSCWSPPRGGRRETLDALEPWREPPEVETLEALYDAPASRLLDALRGVVESIASVLLIGHNPGLKDLAMLLAARDGLRRCRAPFPRPFRPARWRNSNWRGPGRG